MVSPLDKEVAFFDRQRSDLLARAEGKFVLVKDEAIVSIFDSRDEALDAGYERFGSGPFLVREVRRDDETVTFAMFAFP